MTNQTSDWTSMSTAPRDGSTILVMPCSANTMDGYSKAVYFDGSAWSVLDQHRGDPSTMDDSGEYAPVGWMLLPKGGFKS